MSHVGRLDVIHPFLFLFLPTTTGKTHIVRTNYDFKLFKKYCIDPFNTEICCTPVVSILGYSHQAPANHHLAPVDTHRRTQYASSKISLMTIKVHYHFIV